MVSKSNQSRRNLQKASPSRIIPFRIPKSRRIIETQVINRKSPKRRSNPLHSPTSDRRIHKNSHLIAVLRTGKMPVPQYMNFRAAVLGTGKMPVPQYMNFRAAALGTGKMPVPQYMNFVAAVLITGKMPVPQYMNFLVGSCS